MLPAEQFARYWLHLQGQAVQKDWQILNMNTSQSVETSETTYRKTESHSQEEQNFQQHRFQSLTFPPFHNIDNNHDDDYIALL